MKGQRLDISLVERGMLPSREKARAMIMAGLVYVNGDKAEKAGQPVSEEAVVEVRGIMPYVSRGGLKLEKALQVFPLNSQGKVCMDVGASTGGFTDCMLQNGASKVYAVDVGYGQLAWKLRCDERVVNMERTNIRKVGSDMIQEKIEFFSVDVSFISLFHIFPVLATLCGDSAEGVCLIKPQFEAGREKVGKNGVVREKSTHCEVIEKTQQYASNNGFSCEGLSYSPIKGPEGNIEFLLHVCLCDRPRILPPEQIEDVLEEAHQLLNGGKE